MLIKIIIKYSQIIIIFLFPQCVQAKDNNYIYSDIKDPVIKKIDNFFLKNPKEKYVVLVPKINGRSRYAFSILKNAYVISKKNGDSSDLYYLSNKINNGVTLHQNMEKNIDFFISRDDTKVIYKQNLLSNINADLFLEKKEKSFGIILTKDFIISKNSIGNFGFEQAKDAYSTINTSFVKLSKNENTELSGKMSYKHKSNIVNLDIKNTWFDIADKVDFTIGLLQENNKLSSNIYTSIGEEKVKLKVGLNRTKNTSNINLFISLTFGEIINNKYFKSRVSLSSKDNMITENLSLKNLRKQHLDKIWRKKIKF